MTVAGIPADDLRDICARAIADLDIAGAQAAVMVGEDIVATSVGIANVDLGTPVTDDTIIQIGSTTKVYTALLMMQLADRGLVDIDAPVTDYLPDVQLASTGDWRSITPRHLMSMSSGLDNGPYTDTGVSDDTVQRYVDLIASIPLHFAPGSSYGYSNASTVVSGLIIERVTGMTWDDALLKNLLEPAGLRESVTHFARLPYFRVGVGRFPGEDHVFPKWTFGRGTGPAGSTLATTASDLALFGRIFLRKGLAQDGTRILSEEAVETIQTPQVGVPSRVFAQDWCVGPYRKQWGETSVWGHSGTTKNGSSTLLWIPEYDISIATIVNTPPRGYPFADAVFDAVLRDRFGIAKPGRPSPGSFGPVDVEPYLGRYAAWGLSYDVTHEGEDLVVTLNQHVENDPAGELEEPVRSVLRPIAPHRFFPENDAITSFHTWDLAFAVDDGPATLLHNGAFTAPRV
jgi:CubicO group peptidase (beta-lactamase class C family)